VNDEKPREMQYARVGEECNAKGSHALQVEDQENKQRGDIAEQIDPVH
jgi:hypothetical protein